MNESQITAKPINIGEVLKENYIIPIYQRPYTWEKDNIIKLVNTILAQDDIYLGNILIEKAKDEEVNTRAEGDDQKVELRIIDGQQRITSLLLMLYYLNSGRYDKNIILKKIKIESENERQKLEELFSSDKNAIIDEIEKSFKVVKKKEINNKERDLRAINIYKLNFYYIAKLLENQKEITEEKILNNIYIVNITIENNLNTTEIFDRINTTGKPLDTKDKFKIRLYNYQDSNEEKENIGKYIDGLYESINKAEKECIEEDNEKTKRLHEKYYKDNKTENYISFVSERYNIEDFLRLYQFFLISKKRSDTKYSRNLFEMSIERFYEGLFEYLFSQKRDNKKISIQNEQAEKELISYEEELDNEDTIENETEYIYADKLLFQTFIKDEEKNKCIEQEEMKEVFEALTDFKEFVNDKKNWKTADDYFAYELFKGNYCNRYYNIYKYLPILYFYRFKDVMKNEKEEFTEIFKQNFGKFIVAISKLCSIYSITKDKIVIDCRNLLSKISIELLNNNSSISEIIENEINPEINKQKEELENVISGDIAKNYSKHIICLIIAKEAEEFAQENNDLKDHIELLFSAHLDIEHIYAKETNNKDNKKLEDKYENGIGNLMILESSINRSIRDSKIYDLKEKSKISSDSGRRLSYRNSQFEIVRKFIKDFEETYKNEEGYKNNISNRINNNIEIIKKYFE